VVNAGPRSASPMRSRPLVPSVNCSRYIRRASAGMWPRGAAVECLRTVTRSAVKEDATDTGMVQRRHIRVGVPGAAQVVGPVRDSGDPRVQGLQRTPQGPGIDIDGGVVRRDALHHRSHVSQQGMLTGAPAQRALPHMAMGVDHPRHHHPPSRIDDARIGGLLRKIRTHCGDLPVPDQDVAVR